MTDFTNKIKILGAFYANYRDDSDGLKEFFDFNDIGAPLAYLCNEGLCEVSDDGKKYIAETWDILLTFLEIEDIGFNSLEELLLKAKLDE